MMARLVSICGVPIEVRPAFRLIPLTPTNALLTLKFWNAETVKLSRVEGGVPRVCPPATNRSTVLSEKVRQQQIRSWLQRSDFSQDVHE